MKERAVQYYEHEYNCSQCILKALESEYNIPIDEQMLSALKGVSNGFGVGGFCSALIAGIMAIGILFDEQTTKRLRIKLLDGFMLSYHDLNCSSLIKKRDTSIQCEEVISVIAELLETIINTELHPR